VALNSVKMLLLQPCTLMEEEEEEEEKKTPIDIINGA
jgi:hypothetical protein